MATLPSGGPAEDGSELRSHACGVAKVEARGHAPGVAAASGTNERRGRTTNERIMGDTLPADDTHAQTYDSWGAN